MILINLLPHREAARKKRRDIFNVSLGASALLGGSLPVAFSSGTKLPLAPSKTTTSCCPQKFQSLRLKSRTLRPWSPKLPRLRARQQAVEDLQSDRNVPVHLLAELVSQLPDGVYVNKMVQVDQVVTLNGVAQSNETGV